MTNVVAPFNRLLSIAPMMDCTDRHYRYFMRLITKHVLLYTEMIHANQIIHGDKNYFLGFNPQEQPIAIQLGGHDPNLLTTASVTAENWGYQEINLNIGCPSDRVQKGKFGACLMNEPNLVAECVAAIKNKVSIPVTVKTRIGVDHNDSYEFLCNFIEKVKAAGCKTFIIHARKAWLKGLSPKQNRTIPPLDYERVYQLKKDYKDLEIIINGGIKTSEEIKDHLNHVDGVMIGRKAYSDPYLFSNMDSLFYNSKSPIKSRMQILKAYLPYLEQELKRGVRINLLTRHMVGLFHGLPNAKAFRHFMTGQLKTLAHYNELLNHVARLEKGTEEV